MGYPQYHSPFPPQPVPSAQQQQPPVIVNTHGGEAVNTTVTPVNASATAVTEKWE